MAGTDPDSDRSADNIPTAFHLAEPDLPADVTQAWWVEPTSTPDQRCQNPWRAMALYGIIVTALIMIALLLL